MTRRPWELDQGDYDADRANTLIHTRGPLEGQPIAVVTGGHPYAVRVYDALRARGCAPPLPREYGLRLISETLRTAEHLRLLETAQEQKP